MFTLLKEFWTVPLLFALLMLAMWFIARLWKRKSAKAAESNRIETRSTAVANRSDEIQTVNSRSLSGMEDHDFQTLNPRTSKIAKTVARDKSTMALASRRTADDRSDFANLDEVGERELSDRSFDDPGDNLEPIVFPRPPEPALVLSNESLRHTVKSSQHTPPRNVAAKSATHDRLDRGESINQTARNLSLPPRIPRVNQLQEESKSDSRADLAPSTGIMPVDSPQQQVDENSEPPAFTPKYIFTAHPILATWSAFQTPPDDENAVKPEEEISADDEGIEPSDLELAFAQVEGENRKLNAEFEQATKMVAALQAERDDLQTQLDALLAERDELTASNTRIENLVAELAESKQRCESLQTENAELRNQLGHLESNKSQADTNRALLHGELQAKQTELTRLQEEFSLSQQQLETLSKQLAVQVVQASQAAEMIKQRDELQTRLASMTRQLQTEKGAKFELAIAKTTLESSLAAFTNQLAQKESERRQLALDLELAAGSLKQATQQQAQQEAAIRAAESQVAELRTAVDAAEKLRQENQQLMQQLASLQTESASDQLKLQNLQEQVERHDESQLTAANALAARLKVELQAAEETATYLEIARDEAINRLEQERADRSTAERSLASDLAGQLADQRRQFDQLAAESQTIANQLEMVRRDQEVAVTERNRFVKEVALAESRAAELQSDCQAHLELVNQLNAEKAELLRQLEELKRNGGFADDLTRISGIGKVLAGKLRGAGVTTFEQIMNWDQPTVEQLNATLGLQGRIQRDKWIEQAAQLFREAKVPGKE